MVAPLDWGLGHATRCVPIINALLTRGLTVIIATDGPQEFLLRHEFPQLQFLKLSGYHVRYANKRLSWHLLLQTFKIRSAIRSEERILQKAVQTHHIDWVISDNRYGLASKVPSVFITHQLRVRVPRFIKGLESLVQHTLYRYINRFQTCWVPDLADDARGLSGTLGHPVRKPGLPVQYVGWLSRFIPPTHPMQERVKCLIILSGPEPQRSLLENIIVGQLTRITEQIVIVRGLPGDSTHIPVPENVQVFNHLESDQLNHIFNQSEFIVARSGYSTLMDAFTLQKKCIFIPTPGQTEQEYLAERLKNNQMALIYRQDNFDLAQAIREATEFQFHFPLYSMNNLLDMAIDGFIEKHFST